MESVLFTIRSFLPDFPKAEKKVAEYVLFEPLKVIHYNVTELARHSGVSQAAIVRFSRRIGMKGFPEFKVRLSQDVYSISEKRSQADLELKSDMDPAQVVKGVIGGIQSSMDKLEILCDVHYIRRAVDLIRKARLISVFGIGSSALVAQNLHQKLTRIGFLCTNNQETHLQIMTACNLNPGDVAFMISYSGETSDMVTCAQLAKKRGASLITLTGETENAILALADVALRVPSMEQTYRTGASVPIVSQIAIIDMIYFLLASKNLNLSMRALEETRAATRPRGS